MSISSGILGAVLGCCLAAHAQMSPLPPERLAKVQSILDAIYRVEYETARERSKQLIAEFPGEPDGYVYLARVHWQELLLEDRALTVQRFTQPDFFSETPRYKTTIDPAGERLFLDASAQAIAKAKEYVAKKPKDPAALFLLGAAYQNEATFQVALKNAWLSAVRSGNRSYHAHRDLAALNPAYLDTRLVTGVYNYTVGSLPWKIKWLSLLLGYQGTTQRGKEELELAASKGVMVADDAKTILALIYAREKQYEKAIGKLMELKEKYPENYLTHLEIAGVEIRRGRTAEAVELYKEALARIEAKSGSYARLERTIVYNQIGIALRTMKDYSGAESWFLKTLNGNDSSARSKSLAHLELGKTLDLQGKREEALRHYRQVQQAPDYGGSHREASQHLSRPYQPR